jgi:hypothetical protein
MRCLHVEICEFAYLLRIYQVYLTASFSLFQVWHTLIDVLCAAFVAGQCVAKSVTSDPLAETTKLMKYNVITSEIIRYCEGVY